jgi:hypothetical protein
MLQETTGMSSSGHATYSETELLALVQRTIPTGMQRRYNTLIARRRAECLTEDEHQELLRLTEQIEEHDARRAEYLAALARLRGMSIAQVMTDIGIDHPASHG